MTLNELKVGQSAVILGVGGEGGLRQHFLDMGIIPGTVVTLQKFAPFGDPMELRLHGYELTLRLSDAACIEIAETEAEPMQEHTETDTYGERPHPKYGEEGDERHTHDRPFGIYRSARDTQGAAGTGVEWNGMFALIGNQNCGKTTLFNQLTGSRQHVGNFPGVTVEGKTGEVRGYPGVTVTDLPGIYSLSPYTSEETVSREFLLKNRPDGIINIVDATNIERNLYLTMQLMELNIPMVLALNMMDEVDGNGGTVRINEMEHILGIPVVAISAMRNEGVDEVMRHAVHVARYGEVPARVDFCNAGTHDGAVHRCLHSIMHFIEDHAERAGVPVRFAAGKIVEGDKAIVRMLGLSENEMQTVEHIVRQMEEERGLDRLAAMADMRYEFIQQVCGRAVVHPRHSREHLRSMHIDKVLTGKYTAIPSFLLIMGLVFYITFNSLGAWAQDALMEAIDWFTEASDAVLVDWGIAPPVRSLVIDGIYGGVGTVLSFLPLIVLLFFFLSLLEDSGYMARIAFVTDRLLRRIGLSGRSIVPMLVGFGCSVPAIMASRTLPSERDRRMTIMLTPFMSCTAKIPVYAFFAVAFFPAHAAGIVVLMYVIGILAGLAVSLILKVTVFRGGAVPFVMELPNYRMPSMGNVMRLLWDKARDFVQRAFTVIFLASIAIWFLQTFDFHLQMVREGSESSSMLAVVANAVAPVFTPLGFDDWRIVTSLVSGLLAKEVVVSTLGSLFSGDAISAVLDQTTAFALLVFCLLYTPCVAAIATIRRELGGRWAILIAVGQCVMAWVVAYFVRILLS